LIISSGQGKGFNGWGNFYIQIYQKEGLLIGAQKILTLNNSNIAQVKQKQDTGKQTRLMYLQLHTALRTVC
jgi:hypothetical protein